MKNLLFFLILGIITTAQSSTLHAQDYFKEVQAKIFLRDDPEIKKGAYYRIDFDGRVCSIDCSEFNEAEKKLAVRISVENEEGKTASSYRYPVKIEGNQFMIRQKDKSYKKFGEFKKDSEGHIILSVNLNGQLLDFITVFHFNAKYKH